MTRYIRCWKVYGRQWANLTRPAEMLTDVHQAGVNLGMAMTFTLVSHLREQLSALVVTRAETRQKEEMERERIALEVRLSRGAWASRFTFTRRKRHERAERLLQWKVSEHGR
jgi:hypothetical protein